jgi:hypothetical protein
MHELRNWFGAENVFSDTSGSNFDNQNENQKTRGSETELGAEHVDSSDDTKQEQAWRVLGAPTV